MRKLWLIGGAAVVIAAGAAFVVLTGAKSPLNSAKAKDKKTDVTLEFTSREVVSPKNVALPRRIEFSGSLVAPRTAIVRAKAAGTLLDLKVDEGSRVRAGQVLGAIDLSDLQARVSDRAAAVDAAQSALDEAQREKYGNANSWQSLPGVGPKSAQRIAFHVLASDPADVRRLAQTLIEVKDKPITLKDITANPRNFKFTEIANASLPQALTDKAAAIVTLAFALPAGLSSDKQLLVEGEDSPFYNVLAVKADMQDDPRVQKLFKLLTSQDMRDFIESEFKGLVIPAS